MREGQRGVALALYIDVDDEDWEEYSITVPSVLALDIEAGETILSSLREAMKSQRAVEVSDDASEAIRLILATGTHDQALIALMVEGLSGICSRDPRI
jgi:hypothetical protein